MQAGAAATLRFIDAEVNYKCLDMAGIVVTTGPKYWDSWLDYGAMRLICPNCGAQYEVANDAIPAAGRDVQCSNCGHAWFQRPQEADIAADDVATAEVAAAVDKIAEPSPKSDEMVEPTVSSTASSDQSDAAPAPDAVATPDADAEIAPPAEPEAELAAAEVAVPVEPAVTSPEAPSAPAPSPSPSQRSLDDSLMAVLREEAEREVSQRRAEASRGIETQPELGLDAALAAPADASIKKVAPVDDFSDLSSDAEYISGVPGASVRPAARRDLLPDVEVISSTLRSSSGASDDDNPMPDLPPIRRQGGFRSGFLLSVLLAVIVVVAYILAPRLAEQFPAAKGALDAYVAGIDALRLWIGSVVASLNGMLESQG